MRGLPDPRLWDDERGEDAAVGLLTAWAAGHRFTLVSKLDSRAFFELGAQPRGRRARVACARRAGLRRRRGAAGRAGKMLVCGIVDPNVDKQGQQWREALLALARPGRSVCRASRAARGLIAGATPSRPALAP
jgi:hypothetical protein